MFLQSSKLLVLSGLLAFSSPLFAQQKKDLTFSDIFTNPAKDIINPVPYIRGWADNTHYIEYRNGTPYTVDVKTGNAVVSPPAQVNEATVSVRNKDVFYRSLEGQEKQLTRDTSEEKNPTISPDGKQVAFTRNNDLYSVDIASGKETRYTTDGSDVVYNGWASWVYFEEILGRPTRYKAFWWSPDSKHIAFMHFDDSEVPMFPIYASTGQHGYLERTRYPKAGDENPEVKMGIVATGNTNIVWADFDAKADQYFGTPFWMADSKSLWMQWMNRDQNDLIIYTVNPDTGKKSTIYEEAQKTWVDWFDGMYFLKNGSGFILKSDKTGWGHFYYYDLTGKLKKQLTSGDWRVGDLLLVDEKAGEIFFTARKEASTRFDLYRVSLKGGEPKRLTFGNFDHNVVLSPDGNYFVDTYSNLQTPTQSALLDRNGKVIRQLGNSKGLQFNAYNLPKTELVYYTTRDGLRLPMTVTYPLNFDPAKKYPMWISIYGGPDAGTVYDRWKTPTGTTAWWAKEGILQVAIDNRSAGHLGKTGMNYIYRQLGKHEIEDYMDAVKSLEAKGFVDEKQVGITGTSFGGYMTAMALTYGADVFTRGIAISSPTDWSLYDTHYTERFMDTPQDNAEGYKVTSPITYADKLKGELRVIHGDMDDNVHMQNSVQFIDKLQNLNKHFEYMVYPGNRHGVSGTKVRHNNQETVRFIYRYLLDKPIPQEFYSYWK
ncbi:MAG: peptidase dipeptidylpeptidase domain protein [Sphingobacteriaceae bacterium]|jgi:dipeptidyl-peptidase-4|nr:peptidase dipeptidylpeptidase domain protein [Sphingobacteriaceae bacterium]